MTTPTFTDVPPQPSLPTVEDLTAAPEFGPDHTASTAAANDDGPPKSANGRKPRPVADAFKGLGSNKKARSGVRRLTDKDRDKIHGFYMSLAAGSLMFKPKASEIIRLSADEAADAWMEWAEENDNIRRWILRMMEGGALTHVIAINIPIAMAFIPDSVWEKLPPVLAVAHPDVIVDSLRSKQNSDAA